MHRRDFVGMSLAMAGLSAAGVSLAAAPAPMTAATFHASRKFVHTSYGKIAFVERGSGEAALLLHGFPLNSFQWRDAIGPLSATRRCIAPDFLALGYTEVRPHQDVGPDSQVAMLAELLDKLGIGKVDLIANDSGGAVAQLFAVRHPQRVRTMLLTNCDSEIDCPPAALAPVIDMARQGKFGDTWLAPWLANKDLGRSAEGLGGMCFADPAKPTDDALECYLRPLLSSPRRKELLHAYALGLERNSLAGIETDLRNSRIPTRIVWGAADTIFSQAGAHYLDRTLGRSMGVRYLATSKLFWPEERPDVIVSEALALWVAA